MAAPITVKLEKMGSQEIYLSVLDESRKPDVTSPVSSLQMAILQELWTSQFGSPIVNAAGPATISQVYAEIALFF